MKSYLLLLAVIITSGYAHEGHHHNSGPNIQDINSFSDPSIVRNEEHLKEHMQKEVNTDKPLTPEEMEFHYFRLHDLNNDTRLDGLEILKALMHMMPPMPPMGAEHTKQTPEQIEEHRKQQESEMFPRFTMIIDKVLLEDDVDRDGYISYPEYISARRRDEVRMREHMARQQQHHQQQQQQFQNQPMQYQNQQHPPQQQQFQNQAQYNQPLAQPNQQQFQQQPNQYPPPNQQYQAPNQQYQQHPPNQQQFQQQQKVPPGVNPHHYQ